MNASAAFSLFSEERFAGLVDRSISDKDVPLHIRKCLQDFSKTDIVQQSDSIRLEGGHSQFIAKI
ncbi:hypothetical protein NRIC_12080 [Enterococcus florum]|uniref:Uncharacterized protein n=1 Tax=Enterococcus florum TaxID=2480627 RepID=A0A4P5P605_9ENTE|nr:hypothetical protein [Enterococcus florum]GCF93317.1 hypothetical protein NRIC_12080 [Enterococcus florum]